MGSMKTLTAVLGVLLLAGPGLAQSADEVRVLRKEVEALRKDVDEIKSLLRGLRGPQQPENVVLTVDGAAYMGNKNAKITVVEFSDYQCPFCSRHAAKTLPQLVTDYVKTGKVKYVLRDFPLESMHPAALKAAEAAHCAGEQQKYWEMHDRLLAAPKAVDPKELPDHAKALGLDAAKLQQCVESGKYTAQVRRDLEDGLKAGVSGTPTFFVGLTDPKEPKIKSSKVLMGAQPFASFKEAIDGLLSPPK